MTNKNFAGLLLLLSILLSVSGFSQAKSEAYDYKYVYHGKGMFYIHGEPVTKKDYDLYIHANVLLATVPEVELVAEGALYGAQLGNISGGLNFRLPVTFFFKDSAGAAFKNFNLNWKALAGITGSNTFYLHTNGESVIVAKVPLGASASTNGNSIGIDILTIFVLALPEGFGYTIPFKNHFRLNTFLNPLGGDYWKDSRTNYLRGASTMDIGIKPSYVMANKMTLGITLGYQMLYADGYSRGLDGGISLGWQLY
jgi:hypothetical protein